MRILFFGTPAFAVPSLQALIAGGHDVVAVITQPDRSHGRSRSVVLPPPVKLEAIAQDIPVLQPEKPVGSEFLDDLRSWNADLGVVVAYGHILRTDVLRTPTFGMVNVHASLLPRWRGAAPIQWAIRSGDSETGITIMQMEAGLDSGPIWHVRSMPIESGETAGALTERLSHLGAEALLEALPAITAGGTPAPQDTARVTLAPKVDRSMARIDWSASAGALAHHLAAFDPSPGAWTTLDGIDLKLFRAEAAHGNGALAPGTVLGAGEHLVVATGEGSLLVHEVQPSGKKRQAVAEWVRGRGIAVGDLFH